MNFINRNKELDLITQITNQGKTAIFMGRRRVGKTRLLLEWNKRNPNHLFLYSQAIESNPKIQLSQIWNDIAPKIPINITPNTWEDLFKLFNHLKQPATLVIDEFPYLTQTDSSLPSRFQKWLDHNLPQNFSLILLGSSQTLMQDLFFNSKSPLYDRFDHNYKVEPLKYQHFCEYHNLDGNSKES